ncbi:hypothetical protein IX327_001950 [Porphyromonas levii]|nr:hypothetical protein [Porphyromonas levii]
MKTMDIMKYITTLGFVSQDPNQLQMINESV